MKLQKIHALWPEKQGFSILYDRTEAHCVFIHFLSEVKLQDGSCISSGGCIFHEPYSYRYFRAEKEPLLHDWFHAEGDLKSLLAQYGLECNRVYYPYNDHRITKIMKELEAEFLTSPPFSSQMVDIKIQELVATIARGVQTQRDVDWETEQRFMKLRSFMQTNHSKIQDVEKLSQQVGLCPSKFYTTYKKIFDISPKQDLIRIKMEHAMQLLPMQKYSIAEIAELVGYTNPFHFTRQFKTYTGTTPLRFSKQ